MKTIRNRKCIHRLLNFFTTKDKTACIELLPTGIFKTLYNVPCFKKENHAACHYKKCVTLQGEPCIFPFTYANVSYDGIETEITYTVCSTQDLYKPWCPTGMSHCHIYPNLIAKNFKKRNIPGAPSKSEHFF